MPTIWDEYELQKRKAFIARMREKYPEVFGEAQQLNSPETEMTRADSLSELYRSTPCVLGGARANEEAIDV